MHPHSDSDNLAALEARTTQAVQELVARRDHTVIVPEAPLSEWTTLRIGGPAAGLCRVRTTDDALEFLNFAHDKNITAVCLGGGSNILADDRGCCALVLHMELDEIVFAANTVRVGAGRPFDTLIGDCLEASRPGLTFASGIPGSVGGAVVGNAGCYGHEIGEFLLEATVLRADGRIETIRPEACGFGYRTSNLKGGNDILLEVLLRAETGSVAEAVRERRERIEDRRAKHPVDEPSAGSYFQNLPPSRPGERRRPAGSLLDECGVRGWREGGAEVYAKHANIIINTGFATCRDVLKLAARMRDAVEARFGEILLPEVRFLPRYPHRDGFGVDTGATRPDL